MPGPAAGTTIASPGAIIGSYFYSYAMAAALATIAGAAKNVTEVMIDNKLNTVDVELHLWDALIGSVVFGTTEPDAIFTARAGKPLPWPLEYPMAFTTGIVGALTLAGGKTIIAGPPSVVPVYIGLS